MTKSVASLSVVAILCALLYLVTVVRVGHAQNDQTAIATSRSVASTTQQDIRPINLKHMERQMQLMGFARDEWKLKRAWADELGMAHMRVQQMFQGVPVFGGEMIVHWDKNDAFTGTTNGWIRNLRLSAQPSLTKQEAMRIAVAAYGCAECLTAQPRGSLWVMRRGESDHLVYRVQLRREDGTAATSMPVYFVDAHAGNVVWSYDNLQTVTGSGRSRYDGTVSFETYLNPVDGKYYLQDLGRHLGTFSYRHTFNSVFPIRDDDNVWTGGGRRAAIEAQYAATLVLDYYQNVHHRNGLDPYSGGPFSATAADGTTPLISSKVHYGTNYVGAYWDGSSMTYGDGNGVDFSPLVTIDIAGHEMTHAVTACEAALIYSGEPGALSESMSDVFGAMIERYAKGLSANTWRMGEDAYTPGIPGDAFRYLDNPIAGGDPDNYSNLDPSGDVHKNAGIPNKVFYLVAMGNAGPYQPITGLGPDAAEKIWYRALTTYMGPGTDFAHARDATLAAASDLYGQTSVEWDAVSDAWGICGVGRYTPPIPVSADGLFANGDFESGFLPWVTDGGASYIGQGGTPHAGHGYVSLYDSYSSELFQQFNLPTTATSTNLSFFLNVVSDETSGQWDFLFIEVCDVNGFPLSTLATFSNTDKTAVGTYRLKGPYDLSAYKGQKIRLRFRGTNDGSLSTTYRIDDVSIR